MPRLECGFLFFFLAQAYFLKDNQELEDKVDPFVAQLMPEGCVL